MSRRYTGIGQIYERFWDGFLPKFQAVHPGWTARPRDSNWVRLPAAHVRAHYAVSFCEPAGNLRRFRVSVHFRHATDLFDEVESSRYDIEEAFGAELSWSPLERGPGARIATYFAEEVDPRDETRWPNMVAWAVQTVGSLKNAVNPVLAEFD